MGSPWLRIPLSDYEQHMALPTVGQAEMLSNELAAALATHRPRSLAVIGCAGGNGFDRLGSFPLQRVVGIDINPAYIEVTRHRYGDRLTGLELHVADIESGLSNVAPVDLAFAGLVFEHVAVKRAMRTLYNLLNDNGVMVVVLQLPGTGSSEVSPSPYISLQTLSSSMQLHDPGVVAEIGELAGLVRTSSSTLTLPSGKGFAVLTFQCHRPPRFGPPSPRQPPSR